VDGIGPGQQFEGGGINKLAAAGIPAYDFGWPDIAIPIPQVVNQGGPVFTGWLGFHIRRPGRRHGHNSYGCRPEEDACFSGRFSIKWKVHIGNPFCVMDRLVHRFCSMLFSFQANARFSWAEKLFCNAGIYTSTSYSRYCNRMVWFGNNFEHQILKF